MKRHASMNRLYRTLWSEAKQAFVVVAEIAKGHPKSTGHHDLQDKLPHDMQPDFVLARHNLPFSIRQLLGISLLGFASTVMAEPALNAVPTGGQITQGSGSISQTGNTLNVQQTSDKMVGQWNSFDIGQQATVNFQQPNANSIALNRINDSKPSEIYGKLYANGQVYLLNANGVIFGKTAQIDVGGLVASTQKLSDENFQNGKTHFEANGSTGSIDNQGQINAHGGVVVFIAPQVKNSGSINNPGGNVVMAAGEQVSLDFDGDGLITVKVDKAAVDALADNKGLIRADGGAVVISAQSANALMNTVVNNDGVIQAKSLQNHHGRIILDGGDQGQTTNAGTLDVSSNTAQGGQIQVTGEHIVLDNGAKLDASGATAGGEVLVGGDWQGSGTLKQATTVNMKQGASINVSAKTHGNGGKAVLWSDVSKTESRTIVQGSIVAKGGAISGNGGRIETSGHQVDIAGANISAGADSGHGGLWLIDPYDYSVDATVAGYISAALTVGTSVTIDTASSPTTIIGNSVAGAGSIGDITVSAAITKTGGAEATLTLKAAGHIALQSGANISSSSGKLNTVLWSDTDANGGGYVQLAGSASITTNGGGLWIGGGSGSTTWTPYTGVSSLTVGNGFATGTSSYATGVYLGYGAINTTGGNVAIFGKTATTGSVSSQPSPDTSQWHSGIYSINSGGAANQTASINAGSGSIYLNGVNQLTSNVGGEGMYLNGITLTSSATSGDAITLIGSSVTANYGGGTRGAGVTMIGWANQPVSLNATGGGNIVINGTTSAVSSSYNYGVRVSSAGAATQISTTNGGNISITGTANDTNALYSVAFETATDSIISTGNLSITGINNTGSAKPIKLAGSVRVSGTTDLTAGSVNDITLINGGNDFTGDVRVVSGNNVSLTDANSISLGTASLSGNLTVNALGGNVNLNGNLTSIGSGSAILVKSAGDIVQNSSVIVTTNNGTVTYNSDSDANQDGAIFVKNGSQINTYGGNIVMGGGANPTTTAAYGSGSHIDGIALFNPFDGITPATINAGGGNISLIGHGRDGGGGTNAGFGINSNLGVTIQTVGLGTIGLKGTGGSGGSGVYGGYGVVLDRTSVQAVDGNVDIQGTVQLSSAYAVTMLEGNVSQLNGVITTGIGNINISGAGGNGLQFGFSGGPTLGSGSAEGDITLRSDKVQIDGSTGVTVNTSGSVVIQPLSSSFASALNTTYLTLDSRISALRLGRAGNTASIVLGGVTSIAGSINIYGGDINLNQNLGSTAAGNVLLKGSGVLTIASGKAINTSNGNITLTASRFVNSSGASALSAGGTGTQWQVWSSNADPFNGSTGDVLGGLVYNYKQYGATYGSSTVLGTGNGLLYTYATSKSLTAAITGINAFTSISASLLSTQSSSNASLLSTANSRNTVDAGQLLTLMGDSLFADFTIGTGGRMTLAGDNGTTPVQFSQSGQSLTLLFEGGKPVKAAETLLRLPIFVRAGENVRVTGSFNVLDDGRGLTLSSSEPAGGRVPSLAELNPTTLSTRYAVNVGDGTGLILEMALSSEHILIIRKMGGSATLDEKQLTLLGLSAAKANMSVTFKVLKGVVII